MQIKVEALGHRKNC